MNPKYFKIIALGCRTNQYEAQAYKRQLLALGYEDLPDDSKQADLCIVNTCTVTARADADSIRQIRRLAKANPKARMVVTGCYAQAARDEIESMEEVDQVVSNLSKESLIEEIFPKEDVPEFAINAFPGYSRAFVKVQDGCNSFCSYCIIPYVRGRSRSRALPGIVSEVKDLIESGYKEVVLTGINIGDFDGGNKKETLSSLLCALNELEGLERIRFSSIDPEDLQSDFIDALMNCEKATPSLHLVLQSGSDSVLQRMRRKYRSADYKRVVQELRQRNPDFAFSTDVIVGFPGESEEDFQKTLQFIQEIGFVKVHVFPYSTRPGTLAAKYDGLLPSKIISDRKKKLIEFSDAAFKDYRKRFIGKQMKFLVEASEKGQYLSGHTDNFLKAYLPKELCRPNEHLVVELVDDCFEDGFLAEIVSKIESQSAGQASQSMLQEISS